MSRHVVGERSRQETHAAFECEHLEHDVKAEHRELTNQKTADGNRGVCLLRTATRCLAMSKRFARA